MKGLLRTRNCPRLLTLSTACWRLSENTGCGSKIVLLIPASLVAMSDSIKVACVVLAAGQSRRMGFPKALLEVDGQAALSVIVETLRAIGTIEPIHVVVASKDAGWIREWACSREDVGVQIEVNARSEDGRTGSIQVGLDSLPPEIGATWIWPVDTPCVSAKTLTTLLQIAKLRGRESRVVPATWSRGAETRRLGAERPVEPLRGGHPILIGSHWWPQIQGMDPDQPLRDFFVIEPDKVDRVEVDDPAILWNLNTPGDVERHLGKPAARMDRL